MKKLMILLFLFAGAALFAQENTAQKELLKRANENVELFDTNPEKAFQESKEIEEEARKIGAKEAELKAITNQCQYHKIKFDFENIIFTAKSLYQKATSYKNPTYQVIAKTFLSDGYLYNNLPKDAFRHLNEGARISKYIDKKDSLGIVAKSNLFTAYSDYYLIRKDFKKVVEYVKKSINENDKFSNNIVRLKLQHIEYANLSSAYMNINYDSAKYYAKLSLSSDNDYQRGDVKMLVYGILGDLSEYDGNFQDALFYFKKAEHNKNYNLNHVNLLSLYDRLVEIYRKLDDYENLKLYQIKRDSLKLDIFKNQNKSLHILINEKNETNKNFKYLIISILILFFIVSFLMFRKNRRIAEQEKISHQYLESISKAPTGKDYSNLLMELKRDRTIFMFYFEETFPDFRSQLLEINSKISSSEIEFCALLKLKLTTKEIAQYLFIEPATVRNKKYLIKKKLKIPNTIDFYQWLDDL